MLPAGDTDEVELRNDRLKHVELTEIINKIIIITTRWLFILLREYIFWHVSPGNLKPEEALKC